ncbi:hypothetical protein [Isoptericola croceus]|uniref:hypothetical protein n=1 Tax=Isoptericola croceus TaxID=3031406 RepID=UPI0023FA0F31|nr:hypothetical protein [Isoptericola croceus]
MTTAPKPPAPSIVSQQRAVLDSLPFLATRDPHAWSRYLSETIDLFGGDADVVLSSHHWPTWATSGWSSSCRCSATCAATSTTRRCVC